MQLYECAVHMLNMRDQITDEFAGNKWKLIDVSASTIPSSYLLPGTVVGVFQNTAGYPFSPGI